MQKEIWKFFYWIISIGIVFLANKIINLYLEGFWRGVGAVFGIIIIFYSLIVASIAGRTLKLFAHKNAQERNFWPDKFTKIGIYSCMRHPMHLGLALLPVGIALVLGNIGAIFASGWAVAMALIFILMIEEPQTLKKFENYPEYIKDVKAFNLSLECLKKGFFAIKKDEKRLLSQADSKVEVKGFEAKNYDLLMDLITLGKYEKFINQAIKDLNLKEDSKIIDFGAGTGRNALIMRKFIKDKGEIVGVEIGKEMIEQFLQKSANYKNIKLLKHSILEPFKEKEKFDFVFISFVLHGFTQENRKKIIKNASLLLKKGGIFAILDYNEFDISKSPFFIKFAIRKLECPLAEDFIKTDLKKLLEEENFGDFSTKKYFGGYLRLLLAKKL
jgi:demethylmenaquinone methyltransferase/2-methoxy-6-polyprenyl-1,4-benzoquinol methylase